MDSAADRGSLLGLALPQGSVSSSGCQRQERERLYLSQELPLKSNNSIQVEEGWQLGGEKKEKQTIKKNQ